MCLQENEYARYQYDGDDERENDFDDYPAEPNQTYSDMMTEARADQDREDDGPDLDEQDDFEEWPEDDEEDEIDGIDAYWDRQTRRAESGYAN